MPAPVNPPMGVMSGDDNCSPLYIPVSDSSLFFWNERFMFTLSSMSLLRMRSRPKPSSRPLLLMLPMLASNLL